MTTPWWYNTVLWLLKPLYRWRLRRKTANRAAYALECAERFGPFTQPLNRRAIWVHAVSVGETNAAEPLIRHYLQSGHAVLLTNTTQTGQARAKQLFAQHYATQFQALYLPIDQRVLLRNFIMQHQPQVLLLMETELWPNLCAIAHELELYVLLCNARLSEKSARGYGKVPSLTRPMLQQLTQVLAQDAATAERFVALGLPREKAQVLGNIKFDITVPATQLQLAQNLAISWSLAARRVMVLASTHEPEEQTILSALTSHLQQHPHHVCIVVPRHPQRFDAVYNTITQLGFACHRRSLGQALLPEHQVYLADSMGELWLWYALADVCFVGGSLNATGGGHNMLEPIALNVPTVVGTRVFNFQSIVDELCAANGLLLVDDTQAAAAAMIQLLTQPQKAEHLATQAAQVLARNQGALLRHLSAIEPYLKTVPSQINDASNAGSSA